MKEVAAIISKFHVFYLTQQSASIHICRLFKNNIFPTVKIASPPMIFTQRETSSSHIMGSYTSVFSSQANLIVALGASTFCYPAAGKQQTGISLWS